MSTPLPPYLKPVPQGCILLLRVIPNARHTHPDGERAGRLLLRVHAPPVEGKANAVVLAWAADFFNLSRSSVTLLRGDKSREKDLLLELSPETVRSKILNP